MGKIFDTKTYLRIKLTYTADVASDISSVKIKYRIAWSLLTHQCKNNQTMKL